MSRKLLEPEEIVARLGQGTCVVEAIRAIGVCEVTYYRWRREFGGLKTDHVRRMKDLETENQQLRKAIADPTLDRLILQEAARGNFSLFGAHRSTPFRAHPGSTRDRSCGALASLRGRPVPPHDGIRGSGRSHLSRALGRTA